ncbi:MAG: 4-alpha-glucanotransferase [Rhodospirillales bacterium]|nr:4-alpha-glucanotransferase [Rhodospirillales bacterium]
MTASAIQSRLAALAGIERRYHDVWGAERQVPDETIARLLATMGYAAESEAQAEASLHAAEEVPFGDLLEPVTVLVEDGRREILVTAPEDLASRLEWRLVGEDGTRQEGAVTLGDCPVRESRQVLGRRVARYALPLPPLPLGYHSLTARCYGREATTTIIMAPTQCYLPAELQPRQRVWGLTTQLYALRSARNWGIGDFSDLATLAEGAARHGARAIGVNPLHALFAAEPRHISPYSPSSRLFLNHLYIDPEAVPEFADCEPARRFAQSPETQRLLASARQAEFVDYAVVSACKNPVLELLYRCFRTHHLGSALTERGAAFRAFQGAMGEPLRQFAIFEALHRVMLASELGFSWQGWPLELRDPASPEVAAFAAEHHDHVEYVEFLQFEADRQLAAAAQRGKAAGLSIGLYRDLAVGVDPHGAEAWAAQDILVPGATLGAPPDLLNQKGQDWGLAPTSPLALRRHAYMPFIACLRANMRHAGALRIDHVMALQHLYWVPSGVGAAHGGYVAYPIEELVGILALESQRHRCAVIGEDLGTVPEGFRERMQRANILSYRVLVFERQHDGSFLPPDHYPSLATASVGTHDLSTFRGYWTGRDLEWRSELDLYPGPEARDADAANRERERRLLVDALRREGVLPPEIAESLFTDSGPQYRSELNEAVHRFIGRANARFVLVQIEDACGEIEQANLPGTMDEHPNWRRKLSENVPEIVANEAFARLAAALNDARNPRVADPRSPAAE